MPLYEYQCDACGNRFERIQKFSDPALDTCPSCGGAVRKLLSSPAIQFKGSGWYITDYARKSTGETPASKDSKDAKDAGKKDSAASSTSDPGSTSPSATTSPSTPTTKSDK